MNEPDVVTVSNRPWPLVMRVRPDGREESLAIGRNLKVPRIQVGGLQLEDRLTHVPKPHQTKYDFRVYRLPSTQGEPACSD